MADEALIVIRRGVREKMKWLQEMLLVLAVAVMVILHCLEDRAKEVNQPELVRINVTHVVTPAEESVHDIARKYIDLHKGPKDYARFVFAIKHVNGLLENPRAIQSGDRIIIPLLIYK